MIFWDQFKDQLDEDEKQEEALSSGGSGGDNNDDKDKKSEKSESSKPAEVIATKDKIEDSKPVPEPQPQAATAEVVPPVMPPVPSKPKPAMAEDKAHAKMAGGGSSSGGGDDGGDGGDDPKKSKKSKKKVNTWSQDTYESVLTQRNMLFLLTMICVVTIALSVLLIRYVKSAQTIEPFVIEIEQNSGVPTVVTPVDTKVYSSDEAIKRYFIMKYIRAREEYFASTFQENYFNVVRVLSTPTVYFSDYRPKFSISNPNSPYNIYGESSNRKVVLKSLIFQSANSAQVRIAFEVNGIVQAKANKIVLIEFEFANIEMNAEERFINPLGFQTTFYRIEDESS